MKPLLLLSLFSLLIAEPLAALEEAPIRSDVESVVISLQSAEPVALKVALNLVTEQLDRPPSVIFKPGSEGVEVPPMQVENVRFGDLLSALEELCDVRFKVLNPTPEAGESSLIFVATREVRRLGGRSAWVSPATDRVVTETASPFAGAPSAVATEEVPPRAFLESNAAIPTADSVPTASADIDRDEPDEGATTAKAVPMLAQIPQIGRFFSGGATPESTVGWGTAAEPAPTTQTYAIGPLTSDEAHGQSPEDVIDAINTAWSTSRDEGLPSTGPAAPRLSLHAPSGLLIVRAPADLQSLASQTISNLARAHEQRLQQMAVGNRNAALEEEFRRERDHLEQLHQITLERLKASHASEVDKLRANVAELEAQLRLLQSERREGGN